jgi:hypothetical protein
VIDTLIALASGAAYLAGWFVGTVVGSRWLAQRKDECPRFTMIPGYSCGHIGGGHWRGDGRVGYREMWSAMLPALVWPLALVPFAAYYAANYKPTPKAQAHRIAELEKELGIR